MNSSKTKYDPLIPWLYSIEKEGLLPKNFRKTIPRSTIAQWRQNENERLYGHQFRHLFKDTLAYLEILNEKKKMEQVLRVLAKSWLLMSGDILPYFEKSKDVKIRFIDELQRLCQILPRNIVLKLAKISLPKYRRSLDSLKLTCHNSPIDMCVKTNSHQISNGELIRIKHLVTSIDYACWPKSSIYYHALRKGKIKVCLATFYKYAAMFDHTKFYSNIIERKQGAITFKPNEKIHLDTTFWPLKSGKKAAIVFMSDNYSRAILGYSIAGRKDAINVRGAIRSGIETITKFHPQHICPVEGKTRTRDINN